MALEIRQGLVTVGGARDYGVVIAADGSVDGAATEKLRTEMADTVVETDGPFNFGPDIETLRANCLEETGLPAPVQPGRIAA